MELELIKSVLFLGIASASNTFAEWIVNGIGGNDQTLL
jgi:hypothetical protein